jgi:hypothetical protein
MDLELATEDRRLVIMSSILYVVDAYLPPVIIPVGFIGNIFSWMLMSQPQYRDSTNCLYMRFLAVNDSLYLFTRVLQRWLLVIIPEVLTAPGARRPFCLQYLFFYYFITTISAYLLVVMSTSRLIALMFPLKAKQWVTMLRTRLSLLAITCASLAMHVSSFWRIKHPKYANWLCPYHFPKDGLFHTFHSVTNVFVPAALIFLVNIAIIVTVKRRSNERMKMLGTKKDDQEQDKNITKSLLVVSISYLCGLVPSKTQGFIFSNWDPTYDKVFWKAFDRLTIDITVSVEYCNFAMNSYLYVLSSNRFRKELRRMICGTSGRSNRHA